MITWGTPGSVPHIRAPDVSTVWTMLRVIGAGLPRTGTTTLKAALEILLGGTCYHMDEAVERPGDLERWYAVVGGDTSLLPAIVGDCVAAVDWPTAGYWPELAELHPDALILLSVRDDARAWWASMDVTVMGAFRRVSDRVGDEFFAMLHGLWGRTLGEATDDAETAMALYDAYVDRVRATVPADRLLEWNPKDGWAPLCDALGTAVPDGPLPRLNTREDWARRYPEDF